MGNQSSKTDADRGSLTSSPSPSPSRAQPQSNSNVPSRRNPRRRESVQAVASSHGSAAAHASSPQTARTALPSHPRSRSRIGTSAEMGNDQSRPKSRDTTASTSARASPAPVPVPKHADTAAPPEDHVYFSPPQYNRPPRLPLPIEREPVVAGSPIISPTDLLAPADPGDVDDALARKASLLSSVTGDEDYSADESQIPQADRPAIPTLVEWRQGGHKVYVTGTFTNWDKKYRLHRDVNKNEKDVMSAMVPIPPGTHHLKFIVDGDMRTSDNLPTAVDDYGILVNYLEVSTQAIQPAQPRDIPHVERRAPPGVFPPQVLPPTPEMRPTTPQKSGMKLPPKMYHREIPQYLLDVESFAGEEDLSQRSRVRSAIDSQPAPPTLPGFLGKSILNATQQIKDDASVLVYPNHTVLNHLGTSSIRNGVIATSATTRYKRKYVTTILHKPVSDAD